MWYYDHPRNSDYSGFWSFLAIFLVFMITEKKLEKIQRLTSQRAERIQAPKRTFKTLL